MQFPRQYRVITGFNTGVLGQRELEAIYRVIPSSMRKGCYFGVCYGRLDLIVEIESESAKVASYRFCQLQERMSSRGLLGQPVSMSMILAKPILPLTPVQREDSRGPIRSYTFARPREREFPFDRVKAFLETNTSDSVTASEALWNCSAYPLIIEFEGSNIHDILSLVFGFRHYLDKEVADTSTYITLGYSKEGLATDDPVSTMNAVTRLKLRTFEPNHWHEPITSATGGFERPQQRTGWLDVELRFRGQSVRELEECFLTLRKLRGSEILQSSTVLLA